MLLEGGAQLVELGAIIHQEAQLSDLVHDGKLLSERRAELQSMYILCMVYKERLKVNIDGLGKEAQLPQHDGHRAVCVQLFL